VRFKSSLVFPLLTLVLAGCGPDYQAKDRDAATAGVIAGGIIRFKPMSQWGSTEPIATFGLPVMGETTFISAQAACEGSGGSILPPLGFNQCSTGLVMTPLWTAVRAVGGPVGRTVALRGLENSWVPQKQDNLCWAAALETVRRYLNLFHIPHEEMSRAVANECPALPSQKGADLYQIAFVISKFNKLYDKNLIAPHVCSTEGCIIQSIQRGRPIIALKSSHAILVQGVEIANGTPDLIAKWRILDPAGDGRVETRDPLEMCTADAFIAF
jgi:Papain-like cysteine protease AvrRpt2